MSRENRRFHPLIQLTIAIGRWIGGASILVRIERLLCRVGGDRSWVGGSRSWIGGNRSWIGNRRFGWWSTKPVMGNIFSTVQIDGVTFSI